MSKRKTILDEMIADVYVNKDDGSITILHEKPFDDELLNLQYSAHNGDLIFQFKDKEMKFGEELLGEFLSYFRDSTHITLLQMDMKTKNPIAGLEVPLSIIYH